MKESCEKIFGGEVVQHISGGKKIVERAEGFYVVENHDMKSCHATQEEAANEARKPSLNMVKK